LAMVRRLITLETFKNLSTLIITPHTGHDF